MAANRQSALDALHQADAHSGDAHQSDYAGTMALIGIGRALLAVEAAIRDQNELIASGYDDYRGIETVDTGGRT
jgi:hypothetical protein